MSALLPSPLVDLRETAGKKKAYTVIEDGIDDSESFENDVTLWICRNSSNCDDENLIVVKLSEKQFREMRIGDILLA